MKKIDSDGILTAAIAEAGATGGVLLAFEETPGGGFGVQWAWQGTQEHILLAFSQFACLLANEGFNEEALTNLIKTVLRIKEQQRSGEVAGHA